jgi:hypothetical protein
MGAAAAARGGLVAGTSSAIGCSHRPTRFRWPACLPSIAPAVQPESFSRRGPLAEPTAGLTPAGPRPLRLARPQATYDKIKNQIIAKQPSGEKPPK